MYVVRVGRAGHGRRRGRTTPRATAGPSPGISPAFPLPLILLRQLCHVDGRQHALEVGGVLAVAEVEVAKGGDLREGAYVGICGARDRPSDRRLVVDHVTPVFAADEPKLH